MTWQVTANRICIVVTFFQSLSIKKISVFDTHLSSFCNWIRTKRRPNSSFSVVLKALSSALKKKKKEALNIFKGKIRWLLIVCIFTLESFKIFLIYLPYFELRNWMKLYCTSSFLQTVFICTSTSLVQRWYYGNAYFY